MTTVTRSRGVFKNARAAWVDVRKETGITGKSHTVKANHTPTAYRWEVSRKPHRLKSSTFRRRRGFR